MPLCGGSTIGGSDVTAVGFLARVNKRESTKLNMKIDNCVRKLRMPIEALPRWTAGTSIFQEGSVPYPSSPSPSPPFPYPPSPPPPSSCHSLYFIRRELNLPFGSD